MRERAIESPTSAPLWFAVLGAPAAWATQFLVCYWLVQARCDAGGTASVALNTCAIVATAIAVVVALAAGLSAIRLFRATRDSTSAPPAGRTHFLATVGIAITPLFLFIIVMNGVGAVILPDCHPG
jgi:hypothetical protein